MLYDNTNHPKINTIEQEKLNEFYYSCLNVQMNLLFNGKVHKIYKGLYNELLAVYDKDTEVKVFLYHALYAIAKEAKGFRVSLRKETYQQLAKDNPERKVVTYYNMTNLFEALVSKGYGTLYRGDSDKERTSYKSVFVLSKKLTDKVTSKDTNYLPKVLKGVPYNDMVIVNTKKDTKGKHTRIEGVRGTRPYKNNVKIITDFLYEYDFRDGNNNKISPDIYRVFESNLKSYGRFYFPCQNMKSSMRNRISIDGETVGEWDFVSNHAFLCANIAGVNLNKDFKPYSISKSGLVSKVPEGRQERDVYKLGMMCLLNTKGNATTALRNSWDKELKDFGGKENCKEIMSLLRERNHSYIEEIKKQNASTLQNLDSQILEKTMLYLVEKETPFLPWHDSLVAPSSSTIIEDAMLYGWKEVMGNTNNCFIDRKF